MKIEQRYWTTDEGWQIEPGATLAGTASLVLIFGSTRLLENTGKMDEVRAMYPQAPLVGCSTAGEICDTRVRDDSLVVTAIRFEHTEVRLAHTIVSNSADSHGAGQHLAQVLADEKLVHVLTFSDGLRVNGTELARGLRENLPENVAVTGGLAGDGANFMQTFVCAGSEPVSGMIAAVGLYGDHLKVGYGSLGGWDSFGAERLVTRSQGNILYELDGSSALTLYKEYLGEHAAGLPSTALLFPLALRTDESGYSLVRTVLSVDEQEQSMTFAGDIPQGSYARLMKANFDRLVDGAEGAAQAGREMLGSSNAELALLISCVGRKLVLKQRIEEEVESVRNVLGPQAVLTGFYSYGEISPHNAVTRCELHNQTMTITTFSER